MKFEVVNTKVLERLKKYNTRTELWNDTQNQLAKYGAEVVNEPVVKTDKIITSYCPQTAPEVAFVLLENLVGTKEMHDVKVAMGFE